VIAPPVTDVDRSALVAWYRRNRERSRALFELLADEDDFYSQPIPLRHPVIFYEGHLPGFSFNTLVKAGLGQRGIDPRLEALFARGIDPAEDAHASGADVERNRRLWPSRGEVQQFVREADARVLDALANGDIEQRGHPLLDRAEAAFAILEHEAMHQETLLYMLHQLPGGRKRSPAGYRPQVDGRVPTQEWIEIPPGEATLGVDRGTLPFTWDNEQPEYSETVGAFLVQRHDVTNAAFLTFVEDGGYTNADWWDADDWEWVRAEKLAHPLFWERDGTRWYWRSLFDLIPLPPAWPVYVSHAEASAFARWRGARLMSEAEFQRAAYGTPEGHQRVVPWGDAAATAQHGTLDFQSFDPTAAGGHPAGCSAWGVDDLVGNGWEWTSTTFAPFPGFRPTPSYPQYSADFFDGAHMVMKGASPVTARELVRPTFRNWFRPRYPYVYATFRCAKDAQ
jgi:ergothioneine biosynthesis protein EgtB